MNFDKRSKFSFMVAFLLLTFFLVETASALPLFARKYKLSCVMCRVIVKCGVWSHDQAAFL